MTLKVNDTLVIKKKCAKHTLENVVYYTHFYEVCRTHLRMEASGIFSVGVAMHSRAADHYEGTFFQRSSLLYAGEKD